MGVARSSNQTGIFAIFFVWFGPDVTPRASYVGLAMRSTIPFLASMILACTDPATIEIEPASTLPLCSYYGCSLPSGAPEIWEPCTDNDCWCRVPDHSVFAAALCGSYAGPCFAECRANDTEPGGGNPPAHPL